MGEILKIVHFTTQIGCVTAMSWSPEYRLAIGTKKGVFIFSLTLDPYFVSPELNFVKSFIPTQPMQPDKNPMLAQERVSHLSVAMKNRLTQDRVLAPVTPNADSVSHMRYVGWSPAVRIGDNQGHFLINIGFDYTFRLYQRDGGGNWNSTVDLRKYLCSHADTSKTVLKDNMSVKMFDPPDTRYTDLFRRAYFTATLCISWREENRFYTGQEGGQLVYWSLENGKIKVADVVQTMSPSVTAIESVSINNRSVVFVGSLDGCVNAVLKSGKKTTQIPVWNEEDRLKVLKITAIKKEETDSSAHNYDLVLAKSNFVLALSLQINVAKCTLQVISHTAVNAGISHVVGLEPVFLSNTSALAHTFKSPTKKEQSSPKFLIAAQKGNLSLWEGNSGKGTRKEVHLRLDRRHYTTWGLAVSPGQAVFCLLECVSAFNDHLLLREPARLVFFTLSSQQEIRSKVSGTEFHPDFVELFRTQFFKSGIEPPEKWENLNSKWWISCTISNKLKEMEDQLRDTEAELRVAEAARIIKIPKLLKSSKFHASKFMVKYCTNNQTKKEAKAVLNRLSEDNWKCTVCDGNMKEEDVRSVTCQNNHVWARCGSSQEPCDSPDLITCEWCSAVYLEYSHTQDCILCTGPLTT